MENEKCKVCKGTGFTEEYSNGYPMGRMIKCGCKNGN